MRPGYAVLLMVAALCWAAGAVAGAPAERCEAAKLRAAGKATLCVLNEDAKAVLGKAADPTKCSTKFSEKFTAAESAGGLECPTTGDTSGIEARIGQVSHGIAQALAGTRFLDNGDGTVTDTQTGLMWERKTDDGGLHDWDDAYSWTEAMSAFISLVNGRTSGTNPQAIGLGGHNDWRLPSIDELQTILHLPCGHPVSCIDSTFGLTKESFYWSSTTYAGDPSRAWLVSFALGPADYGDKDTTVYARAVRGGSPSSTPTTPCAPLDEICTSDGECCSGACALLPPFNLGTCAQ